MAKVAECRRRGFGIYRLQKRIVAELCIVKSDLADFRVCAVVVDNRSDSN